MRASSIASMATALLLGVSPRGDAAEQRYTFATLDPPGAEFTTAGAINSAGQIVGYYGAGGLRHGWLLSGSRFSTIDAPGAQFTQASGINTAGEVAGSFSSVVDPGIVGPFHGYLFSAGHVQDD